MVSYADPPTPTKSPAPTPARAGVASAPAVPMVPKKPWQLLLPGEPFDPVTAPEGATERDQVCDAWLLCTPWTTSNAMA